MNLASVIATIGLVQGLFILILLVPQARRNNQAFFAALLMIVFVVDIFTFILYRNNLMEQYDYLTGLAEATLFLYGPVLYLYASSILNLETKSSFINRLIHFVPALLIFAITSQLLLGGKTYLMLEELRLQLPVIFENVGLGTLLVDHVIWYVHAFFYFFLCIALINKWKRKDEKFFSIANQKVRKTQIKWVRYLIIGYLTFPVLGITILFFELVTENEMNSFSLLNYFLVFHIFGISYIGFTNQKLLVNPISMLKYKQSSLDEEMKKTYWQKLETYFENEQPFLNTELTLKLVAEQMDLNPHYVSQVINEEFGFGFNDFINHYRIELAKVFIVSPEKRIYTIEAIANEVGFKSKPTFNTAFKKKEGVTPSEYRRAVEETL
jgi:AraC-like DNA-binding protein